MSTNGVLALARFETVTESNAIRQTASVTSLGGARVRFDYECEVINAELAYPIAGINYRELPNSREHSHAVVYLSITTFTQLQRTHKYLGKVA